MKLLVDLEKFTEIIILNLKEKFHEIILLNLKLLFFNCLNSTFVIIYLFFHFFMFSSFISHFHTQRYKYRKAFTDLTLKKKNN